MPGRILVVLFFLSGVGQGVCAIGADSPPVPDDDEVEAMEYLESIDRQLESEGAFRDDSKAPPMQRPTALPPVRHEVRVLGTVGANPLIAKGGISEFSGMGYFSGADLSYRYRRSIKLKTNQTSTTRYYVRIAPYVYSFRIEERDELSSRKDVRTERHYGLTSTAGRRFVRPTRSREKGAAIEHGYDMGIALIRLGAMEPLNDGSNRGIITDRYYLGPHTCYRGVLGGLRHSGRFESGLDPHLGASAIKGLFIGLRWDAQYSEPLTEELSWHIGFLSNLSLIRSPFDCPEGVEGCREPASTQSTLFGSLFGIQHDLR